MRKLFLLSILCAPSVLAVTCTSATVTDNWITGTQDIGHNFVRIQWTCDTTLNKGTGGFRIKWGTTAAYGNVQGQDNNTIDLIANDLFISNLTGLSPSTTYYIAPSISVDGVTWSADPTALVVTTAAAPSAHPILPTPPTTFDTASHNTSGHLYAVSPETCAALHTTPTGPTVAWSSPMYGQTITGCTDVASIQAAIGSTYLAVATYGDVIVSGPGDVNSYSADSFGSNLILADAPDAANIGGTLTYITDWDTTTGLMTFSAAHGLTAGDHIILGLSEYLGNRSDLLPPPANAGYPYCVVAGAGSDTTHAYVSATCGGTAIVPLSTFGGARACFIKGSTIPNEQEIIIRTSIEDQYLPPAGTRLTLDYDPLLPILRTGTTSSFSSPAFYFEYGCLAHHYRFQEVLADWVPICTAGSPDCNSQTGPTLKTGRSNSHIIFDRVHVAGGTFDATSGKYLPYPDRTVKWAYLEGSNMAFIDGIIDNMGLWTPSNTFGWDTSFTAIPASGTPSQTFTGAIYKGWPTGFAGLGSNVCSNHPTITVTGGTTGTAYWEIASDCTNYVVAPTGMTMTCTDSSGAACNVSTSASPGYSCTTTWFHDPVTGAYMCSSGGLFTRYPISTIGVSGGNITSLGWMVTSNEVQGSNVSNDAPGIAISAQWGPGPIIVSNNTLHNNFGIPVYLYNGDGSAVLNPTTCVSLGCDVGHQLLQVEGDITFKKNWDVIDRAYMPNPYTNSSWNGMNFAIRQPVETKAGARQLYEGNYFSGAYCNTIIAGPAVEVGSLNGDISWYPTPQTTSDFEVRYNTVNNSCGDSFQIIGSYDPNNVKTSVNTQRVWFHDNITQGVDKYSNSSFDGYAGNGDDLRFAIGPQDLTIEHETKNYTRGPSPYALIFQCGNSEGAVIRNNFLGYSNDNNLGGIWSADCSDVTNTPNTFAGFAQALINTLVTPVWTNNWFMSGYQDSLNQVDMTTANIAAVTSNSSWAVLGGSNWVPGNTIAARTSNIGWYGNHHLPASSPYISGGASPASDGLSIGADIDALEAAQGRVLNVGVLSIGTSTATIGFLAPDTIGCTVDWTTGTDFSAFTRVSNAGGSRIQSVSLSGLPSASTVRYRVNCASYQPTGAFSTQ